MKLIDVSTRKHPNTFAQVDDADFEWLNQWKWWAYSGGKTTYAGRSVWHDNTPGKRLGRYTITMHGLVAGTPPRGWTDHKDHNGLNNQRENVRPCSASQNGANRAKQIGLPSASRFKGVHFSSKTGKFVASIACRKRMFNLGYYPIETDAAFIYDIAAKSLFGEFAFLNGVPAPTSPSEYMLRKIKEIEIRSAWWISR